MLPDGGVDILATEVIPMSVLYQQILIKPCPNPGRLYALSILQCDMSNSHCMVTDHEILL
jgi:hypothetical protein